MPPHRVPSSLSAAAADVAAAADAIAAAADDAAPAAARTYTKQASNPLSLPAASESFTVAAAVAAYSRHASGPLPCLGGGAWRIGALPALSHTGESLPGSARLLRREACEGGGLAGAGAGRGSPQRRRRLAEGRRAKGSRSRRTARSARKRPCRSPSCLGSRNISARTDTERSARKRPCRSPSCGEQGCSWYQSFLAIITRDSYI